MKGEHTVVKLQPFNININIVVSKDVWACVKYVQKNYDVKNIIIGEKKDKKCPGAYYYYKGHAFILLSYEASISTIVHECFHCLMHIAYKYGAKWSKKSDEMFAYSIGNFTQEVMDFFYSIDETKEFNK